MPSVTSGSLSSTVPLPPPAGRIVPISLREPFDIHGTRGNDEIDLRGADPGSAWYFSVHAGDGWDIVYGSEFGDRIDGGFGHDILYGYGGDDTLIGGSGLDSLRGGEGRDRLYGGSDMDYLWGGAGADDLNGGDGDDLLQGEAGDDVLEGGRGQDDVAGGSGADRFVFSAADMGSFILVGGRHWEFPWDTIHDFRVGEGDKIDVSSLLDEFTDFAGSTASQAIAQGYIFFVQHGKPGAADFGTTVHIDWNGGPHGAGWDSFVVADLKGVSAHELTSAPFIV